MSPKPTVALAVIQTPNGRVLVRKHYAAKQRSWILILDGQQAALRLVVPGWHPRSPRSSRTQISPPVRITTEDAIVAFWAVLAPKVEARIANRDQTTLTGTSPPGSEFMKVGQVAAIVQQTKATSALEIEVLKLALFQCADLLSVNAGPFIDPFSLLKEGRQWLAPLAMYSSAIAEVVRVLDVEHEPASARLRAVKKRLAKRRSEIERFVDLCETQLDRPTPARQVPWSKSDA